MDQFTDKLKSYKASPSNNAWQQLNNRLEHSRNKRRIKRFKNLSIAASLLAIISVMAVMSIYLREHNPSMFATSPVFEPVHMEQLSSTNDDLYDLEKLGMLRNIYEELGQSLN